MKQLSPQSQELIDQREANSVFEYVELHGKSFTGKYTARGGWLLMGEIYTTSQLKSVGNIDTVAKIGDVGEYSTVTIELLDEGLLKRKFQTEVLDGCECTLYRYFGGAQYVNSRADLIPIIHGRITNVTWSEETYVLSFTLESYYDSEVVGYKAEMGAFPSFNNDVAGGNWPLCVGTVLEVPCIKVQKYGVQGTLAFPTSSSIPTFVPGYVVRNGNYIFPLNVEIEMFVAGVKHRGTINYKLIFGKYYMPVFTIAERNMEIYSNIPILPRDVSDADQANSRVFWIDEAYNITEQYVLVGNEVNYCEIQEGGKCYFRKDWSTPLASVDILSTAAVPRADWGVSYIYPASADDYGSRVYRRTESETHYLTVYRENMQVIPDRYHINKGAPVVYNTPGATDLFVCNLIPSSEIVDVWAHRSYNNKRIYVPVPSSRYIKHLDYSIGGKHVTAIEMKKPLSFYAAEMWDDELYVTVRSSVTENTVTAIRYILETYTSLVIDDASFDAVSLRVQDFWMCGIINESVDALEVVHKMAQQARCALLIAGGIVKIVFLPDAPAPAKVIGNNWVNTKSLVLTTGSIEDVETQIEVDWKKKYDVDRKVLYKNNISEYGVREGSLEATFYNMEYCVRAMVDFWGYRRSNIWRQVDFTSFLNTLDLELFDAVNMGVPKFSTNNVRGVVLANKQDVGSDLANLSLEMASRPTDHISDEPVEQPLYWPGNPDTPDIKDPAYGRSEIDYIPPVVRDLNIDDEDPPPTEYYFKFTQLTSQVTRGQNFDIEIRVFDKDNNLAFLNISALLTLTSMDTNDVINISNVTFQGGVYYTNSAQITGGNGIDSGALTISGTEEFTEDTANIQIVDGMITTMAWTVPASVVRNIDFSVAISGGPANQAVDIEFLSTNILDKVYDRSTSLPITSVTLDASGSYASNDWYILGGSDDAGGQLRAHDPTNRYTDAYSAGFHISGTGVKTLRDVIVFSESIEGHSDYRIEVVTEDPIMFGATFEVSAKIYLHDAIDTTFNGTAILTISSVEDNETPFIWFDGGPNASENGNQLQITITNGEWSYDKAAVDWSGMSTESTHLVGTVNIPSFGTYIDSYDAQVMHKRMVITTNETMFARGVAYPFKITVMNADGTVDTSYNNTNDLPIQITSESGLLIVNPDFLVHTEWNDGIANIDLTFTLGTGTDRFSLLIEDDVINIEGEFDGIIATATTILGSTRHTTIVGYYAHGYPSGYANGLFQNAQAGAQALFPSAVPGSEGIYNTQHVGLAARSWMNGNTYLVQAEYATYITEYDVPLNLRLDAIGAIADIRFKNRYYYPDYFFEMRGTLRILFSEFYTTYQSGQDIWNNNGEYIYEIPLADIWAQAIAEGDSWRLRIPLPKSFVDWFRTIDNRLVTTSYVTPLIIDNRANVASFDYGARIYGVRIIT